MWIVNGTNALHQNAQLRDVCKCVASRNLAGNRHMFECFLEDVDSTFDRVRIRKSLGLTVDGTPISISRFVRGTVSSVSIA